jgi:fatty acid desaturase
VRRVSTARTQEEELAMEDQQQRYERARARVQAIRGFYIHATVFVVVNIGLLVINALTSGLAGGVWWFYWPLIGWGIGLGLHAFTVFGFGGGGGPLGRDWEERKTREMMDKEEGGS